MFSRCACSSAAAEPRPTDGLAAQCLESLGRQLKEVAHACLLHMDEAHGGDIGNTRSRARWKLRCSVLHKTSEGVSGPSNGVTSCIGYHADHLELQFSLAICRAR